MANKEFALNSDLFKAQQLAKYDINYKHAALTSKQKQVFNEHKAELIKLIDKEILQTNCKLQSLHAELNEIKKKKRQNKRKGKTKINEQREIAVQVNFVNTEKENKINENINKLDEKNDRKINLRSSSSTKFDCQCEHNTQQNGTQQINKIIKIVSTEPKKSFNEKEPKELVSSEERYQSKLRKMLEQNHINEQSPPKLIPTMNKDDDKLADKIVEKLCQQLAQFKPTETKTENKVNDVNVQTDLEIGSKPNLEIKCIDVGTDPEIIYPTKSNLLASIDLEAVNDLSLISDRMKSDTIYMKLPERKLKKTLEKSKKGVSFNLESEDQLSYFDRFPVEIELIQTDDRVNEVHSELLSFNDLSTINTSMFHTLPNKSKQILNCSTPKQINKNQSDKLISEPESLISFSRTIDDYVDFTIDSSVSSNGKLMEGK
ncbi:hypothetical protein RDWZM_009025 [Blomia tropicalis]|uniref:Uncharacterized protein n=1 Tax=Blomia tropicalis TaxID=40697 RepID=A0A9Q0RJD0_BLOTA|nr:hypothetical protein RDWZM_009025 [Blomia tropicalis]